MTWTFFDKFCEIQPFLSCSPHFFLFFKHQFPSCFPDRVRRRLASSALNSAPVLHLYVSVCPALSRPSSLALSLRPQAQFWGGWLWRGRPRVHSESFWSCSCVWLQQGATWSPQRLSLPPPPPPPDECWDSSAARWTETEPTEQTPERKREK